MLWRLGWSRGQRELNEGGEGVFILPPPQVTVMCVFCGFGSSGVTLDHPDG